MWFVARALKVVTEGGVGHWGPWEVQGFPKITQHGAPNIQRRCLRLLGRLARLSENPVLFPGSAFMGLPLPSR